MQGERSRDFLARTLLTSADILVLDESFSAMDPETLKTCLEYLWTRRETLFVIAHP